MRYSEERPRERDREAQIERILELALGRSVFIRGKILVAQARLLFHPNLLRLQSD
jgi:hypothetical protein